MTPLTPITDNTLLAQLSVEAPRLPFDVVITDVMKWSAGEHVGLIGPIGQGKTTLLLSLLPLRRFVVVFATKPKDDVLAGLREQGYVKMTKWRRFPAKDMPRRLLWPNAKRMTSTANQRVIFHRAFEQIYIEGGWCVAIDELWYFANWLKLEADIKLFLLQSRSLGISLVLATQRPAHVPLEVYDQSTHLFFWRDNDERNLSRLSGIAWRSAILVRTIIANLEKHQCLYVNTRTGQMCRTRIPIERVRT